MVPLKVRRPEVAQKRSNMRGPLRPPLPVRFTCTGETLLEDVAAAQVAPGVLPPGLEAVTLAGLLLHPGVLLSRGEDGPHVRGSEPPPPAPHRPPSQVAFHPVLGWVRVGVPPLGTRQSLGGPSAVAPGRLQALQTDRLR